MVAKKSRHSAVYLNARLQFREPEKALASFIKKEAARNRRSAHDQIMFFVQERVAQLKGTNQEN